jgi:hypothetical protein
MSQRGQKLTSTETAGSQQIGLRVLALNRQSAAVHHVIGQQFGACVRRIHDPLADQIA